MSTHDEHRFGPDGITPRQFWLMNGNMKAGQLIAIQKADGTLREVVVTYYDAGPPFRIETTDDPEAIEKAREAARAKPVGTVTNGLIDSTPTERADHGLRERIAGVLYELDHPGESMAEASDGDRDFYRRNADAVIRELRLRREDDDEVPPFWPTKGEYRYVTDWETDE